MPGCTTDHGRDGDGKPFGHGTGLFCAGTVCHRALRIGDCPHSHEWVRLGDDQRAVPVRISAHR